MLASRKTFESRSLQSSTSRIISLSQSGIGHRLSSSIYRRFSWGSKYKNATSRAEKVCKAFNTQEFITKPLRRKQLYRATFWGDHHLRRYLPRYAPAQEWRFLSSWGKKPETLPISRNKSEANEQEDWFTRWEEQKLRQYDEFMKRVEHDPYTALFGNSLLNLPGENNESAEANTSSPGSRKETSVPKSERISEKWPSKSNSSSTKVSENKDIGGDPFKSDTIPVQGHNQEYEIDPITNRKVLKASASPLSSSGHTKAQAKGGEKVFERWKLVSPVPPGHCFMTVEHARVSSSSDPPCKDTPHLQPHNSKGWLAQEGFERSPEPKADSRLPHPTHDAKLNNTATKIESALDRHLESKSIEEKKNIDRPQRQYKPEEDKTEDVDLLRPSDVRASAGLRGNPLKETNVDKQARRRKLEEKYENSSRDRAGHLVQEYASDKIEQKEEGRPVQKTTAPELRFGSWLKGVLQDPNLKDTEASKTSCVVGVKKPLDAKGSSSVCVNGIHPVSVHQPDSTSTSKNDTPPEPSNAVAVEPQNEVKDKVDRLRAQVVPFKAKLDAMKADYDFLRQEWLLEIRRLKEKAAKKEATLKAETNAKRAREIHEEEITVQKVAMEAMEMRNSGRNNSTANSASVKGTGTEKPAPRRLQSFLQGEGDMASNVHEFARSDRWYKRKAPHAIDAKDAEMDAKVQRLARDRALIREVRGIYEDTYGIIDTNHRQVPSKSPTSTPCQPITSSFESVAPRAENRSNVAGKAEFSERLNRIQISDALVLIQKLFGQLREAQSTIQDYQTQIVRALDSNDEDRNLFRSHTAFDASIMNILETSMRLGKFRSRELLRRDVVERDIYNLSRSETLSANHLPSSTAPKPTKVEGQKAAQRSTYCILKYDATTESVNSMETTSLAPPYMFMQDWPLPLDALKRLNVSGIFLSRALSLRGRGYKPVSSIANIVVFKKEDTTQDPTESKETNMSDELKPIRTALDHVPVRPDSSAGTGGGNRPLGPTIGEALQGQRNACLRGIELEMEQQKTNEARKQFMNAIVKELQKLADEAIERKRKDVKVEKVSKEAQNQDSVLSAAPNPTSSDKVHRQETVFSGSRQGRWTDNGVKSRRKKRAAGRRRKSIDWILAACFYTAACCYGVGALLDLA